MLCCLVEVYWCFRGSCCFHYHCRWTSCRWQRLAGTGTEWRRV